MHVTQKNSTVCNFFQVSIHASVWKNMYVGSDGFWGLEFSCLKCCIDFSNQRFPFSQNENNKNTAEERKIVKIPKWKMYGKSWDILPLTVSLYFSKVWIVIKYSKRLFPFTAMRLECVVSWAKKKVVLGISWSARWSHSIAQIGSQHSWVLALETL